MKKGVEKLGLTTRSLWFWRMLATVILIILVSEVKAQTTPSITGFTTSKNDGTANSGYVGSTVTVTGTNFTGVNSVKVGGSSGTVVSPFVVTTSTITFTAVGITGPIYISNGPKSATSATSYVDLGYITVADGDYNSGLTWLGGSVPAVNAKITIGHNVYLNSSANTAGSALITAGQLLINGGTLQIGNSGGDNKTLSLKGGALNISSGTLNLNGNASMTGGNFTMSGGAFNIDPNGSTSVAAGTTIFSVDAATTTNVNGGTITFIDAPASGSTTKTLSYSATTSSDWSGSTMVFGVGPTNTNSGISAGFNIDTWAGWPTPGCVLLGDVVANGGTYTNKKALTGPSLTNHGFDIGGTLTINAGCEVRTTILGSPLRIRGNIINNGLFTDKGGISFSQRSVLPGDTSILPNTSPQTVTGVSGSFINSLNHSGFTDLYFNNTTNPGKGVIIDVGDLEISDSVAFVNGFVDIGKDNLFYFNVVAKASRVNGALLRSGGAAMAKGFALGASSFTFHIADTTGTYDYSPVSIAFNSNTFNGRVIGVFAVDAVHPNMNDGAVQTSYISRYWRVTNTPIGQFNAAMTFTYLPEDVVGTESAMQTNLWTGYAWGQAYSNADPVKHLLSIDKVTEDTWPNDTLTLAQITGRVHQNTTYYWNKSSATTGYDWTTAANWTPLRQLVSSSDSLVFDGKTAFIRNVRSSEVVSVVQLKNGSNITLQPDYAATTLLEMVGGIGNVLNIDKTSTLVLKDSIKSNVQRTMSLGFRGSQNAKISGVLTVLPTSIITNNNYDSRNCVTLVDGTINNGGNVLAGSKDSLIISGTYNHIDSAFGGVIPSFTWGDTTKLNIIGYRNFNGLQPLTMPSYLRRVNYNCINQKNTVTLKSLLGTTIDTLFITSSGTGALNLSKGSSLTLTGPVNYTSGTVYADSGTINMTGINPQTIPAGIKNAGTLSINNASAAGVSLVDTFKVIKYLNIVNGQLNTADKLVLKSTTIDSTAIITAITSTNANPINGSVTVERFIPANRRYRFITPSVTPTSGSMRTYWQENGSNAAGYGTHITGPGGAANGFDQTATNNPSVFGYNNLTQQWVTPASTSTTALYAGNAYRLFVRGDRTIDLAINNPTPTATVLRATGKVLTGDVTYNTTGANNTPVLSTSAAAFNLVGNPYAAPVDLKTLLAIDPVTQQITGTARDITASYTTIDPNLSYGTNNPVIYVTYNVAAGTASVSGGGKGTTSAINNIIQPGQGFYIQTDPFASNPNPYITFKESYKASSLTNVFRETPSVMPKLSLRLFISSGANFTDPVDGAVVVYADNFKKTIGLEDSYKAMNQYENIAINRNGTMLSIEGRPTLTSDDSLPIKIWQFRQKNYFLEIKGQNFDPSVKGFLLDRYLKTQTPLALDSSIVVPFSIDSDTASSSASRFVIVFRAGMLLPITTTNVSAYQKNKGIQVDWNVQSQANIVTYEVEKSLDGQQYKAVASLQKNAGGQYNWFDENASQGANYYRIKIMSVSGDVTYTSIVKVDIAQVGTGFTIYPNPVVGKVISLHFNNMPGGRYAYNIYNNASQKVFTGTVTHNGGSANYNVSAAMLPAGNYKLVLQSGSTQFTQNILVQ